MTADAVSPRVPARPLRWPDVVFDLHDVAQQLGAAPTWIVGGAVRDAYLGRALHDIDLVTAGDSVALGRALLTGLVNQAQGDFYVMDRERGVVRLILYRPDGNFVIDLARLRGGDLLADLRDRDFTFNAMAVDLHSDLMHIIDPLNGEQDLTAKRVRQCNPSSIADDPVRGLRAIRMSVLFQARMDSDTRAAIRQSAPYLGTVSAERTRDALFKLLALPRPATALRVGSVLGLLAVPLPEVAALPGKAVSHPDGLDAWGVALLTVEKLAGLLATISPRRTDLTAAVFNLGLVVVALDLFRSQLQAHIAQAWPDERTHESLLVLAALLLAADVDTEAIKRRADALRLSSDERKRLQAIAEGIEQVAGVGLDDLALHRFWRRYEAAGIDLCLMSLARHLGQQGSALDQDSWVALLERTQQILAAYFSRYDTVVEPVPLVDGQTLCEALHIKPGPRIGQLLTAIREAQVVGDVQSVDDALTLARSLIDV